MDIDGVVSTDYVEQDAKTPASKLRGAFDTNEDRVIIITNGGSFEGVVSQKQLLSSHHPPDETAMNVAIDPPQVSRHEDVREVARLMVENELKILPVFDEGDRFVGVVKAMDIVEEVQENLNTLDVEDVYTRDLISVERETTVGQVINHLIENKISRVPVVEDGNAEGMVSIADLVDFTVRQVEKQEGGDAGGFDGHGGEGSTTDFRASSGGYGERAGFEDRLLDLPARDVMTPTVYTTTPDQQLGDAIGEMLEKNCSSLVVVGEGTGEVIGIVTVTDALDALTNTDEERIPVQIFNVKMLDTLSREDVAKRIEQIDAKRTEMNILEAKVVFHEHEERLRGMPLVETTVRLFTDEGRFFGSGEEYGAEASFGTASEIVEENVLEDKGRDMTERNDRPTAKKQEQVESIVDWWLEGEEEEGEA
ncbi:CBS domain-containing protein [Halopelagius fulvigenes]|uniref:CBS domain-containing protein n=1 Tax=Halopelagius fulvigenes TaxID=1198324 RepID=A0ABD5TY25_9EURY